MLQPLSDLHFSRILVLLADVLPISLPSAFLVAAFLMLLACITLSTLVLHKQVAVPVRSNP